MKQLLTILISLIFLASSSCKTKGCMDMNALNFNSSADESDGSCQYSAVTFFASFGYYNGIPINSIDVSVDGNMIGTINAIYPNGPGNCGAQGTVPYTFSNSTAYNWNTIVHLANGGTVFGSGTVSPSSLITCVKVNVTN